MKRTTLAMLILSSFTLFGCDGEDGKMVLMGMEEKML